MQVLEVPPPLTPPSTGGKGGLSDFLNQLQPGIWIKLEDSPSFFSHDEALLLCQVSETQWMTWVPNHGEYLLKFL